MVFILLCQALLLYITYSVKYSVKGLGALGITGVAGLSGNKVERFSCKAVIKWSLFSSKAVIK